MMILLLLVLVWALLDCRSANRRTARVIEQLHSGTLVVRIIEIPPGERRS